MLWKESYICTLWHQFPFNLRILHLLHNENDRMTSVRNFGLFSYCGRWWLPQLIKGTPPDVEQLYDKLGTARTNLCKKTGNKHLIANIEKDWKLLRSMWQHLPRGSCPSRGVIWFPLSGNAVPYFWLFFWFLDMDFIFMKERVMLKGIVDKWRDQQTIFDPC